MKSLLPSPAKKTLISSYRTIKGLISVKPDFIIIGAQRSGTTSLYQYLVQHPAIRSARGKEQHFFDDQFDRGIIWYRSRFPPIWSREINRRILQHPWITGEASPYYLFHPHAAARIRAELGNIKLIVLLRNPIDRAYSQYSLNVKKEREPLSFEDAIEKEFERLAGEKEKMLDDPTYTSFAYQHYSYLSRGIYVDQLRHWMSIFPRKCFLILKSEIMFQEPAAVFEKVLNFLDVPSWYLKEYETYNSTSKGIQNPATRQLLANFYRPHNQALYELLTADFEWDE